MVRYPIFSQRDTNGLPFTQNRSGQSAHFVMPMRVPVAISKRTARRGACTDNGPVSRAPFAFGGVWESWMGPGGEEMEYVCDAGSAPAVFLEQTRRLRLPRTVGLAGRAWARPHAFAVEEIAPPGLATQGMRAALVNTSRRHLDAVVFAEPRF